MQEEMERGGNDVGKKKWIKRSMYGEAMNAGRNG